MARYTVGINVEKTIDADALNRKDVNCANVPMNFIDTAPTIIGSDTPKRRKGVPLEENDSGYNCENWIP